jgi:hypothetical protein
MEPLEVKALIGILFILALVTYYVLGNIKKVKHKRAGEDLRHKRSMLDKRLRQEYPALFDVENYAYNEIHKCLIYLPTKEPVDCGTRTIPSYPAFLNYLSTEENQAIRTFWRGLYSEFSKKPLEDEKERLCRPYIIGVR